MKNCERREQGKKKRFLSFFHVIWQQNVKKKLRNQNCADRPFFESLTHRTGFWVFFLGRTTHFMKRIRRWETKSTTIISFNSNFTSTSYMHDYVCFITPIQITHVQGFLWKLLLFCAKNYSSLIPLRKCASLQKCACNRKASKICKKKSSDNFERKALKICKQK